MFPNSLTNDGLKKLMTLGKHIILESYIDSILPIHDIVIHKVASYETGKLISVRFFIADIIILHVTRTPHESHNNRET